MSDERPASVPDEAVLERGRHWTLGESEGRTKVGEWKRWHKTEGYLLGIDSYDEKGRQTKATDYFPDGSTKQEIPQTKGIPDGVCVYYRSSEFPDTSWDSFPDAATRSEVTWYGGSSCSPRRFFDASGTEISWAGAPKPGVVPREAYSDSDGVWGTGGDDLKPDLCNAAQKWDSMGNSLDDGPANKPDPAAEPVDYRGEQYWRRVQDGVTTFWDSDLRRRWQVTRTDDQITATTTFNEDEPSVEESFHIRQLEGTAPIPKRVVVHDGDKRYEFTCDEHGGCTAFAFVDGDGTTSFDNGDVDGLTHETFVTAFERRFGAVMKHPDVIVSAAGVEVMEVGGYHNEEYVECAGLSHRGNGDAAFVFLETEYAGPVYYLDHEVGPFGLDCIDDLLEDEDIDPESATKEEIVEAFPCVEEEDILAESIDAYLRSVSVASDFTFWRRLDDFSPA